MGRQVIQKNSVFSVLLKTDLEGLKKACVCVGGGGHFSLTVLGCKHRKGLVHLGKPSTPSHICSPGDGS